MAIQFQPWLFDNREAWEKTLTDHRYRYDLTLDEFMALYNTHRGIASTATGAGQVRNTLQSLSQPAAAKPSKSPAHEEASQILSQNEIDSLLTQLKT